MKLIPRIFYILTGLFLILESSQAQEFLYEFSDPDGYMNTPLVLNNHWLFAPYSIEGINGVNVFSKQDDTWQYSETITRPNSWQFGTGLDSYGDWLIIGDEQDYDVSGEIPRSLYFYQMQDSGWTYRQKFSRDFSDFTQSVSLCGEWAIAGDRRNDSLHIYHLENGSWSQHQSIGFDDTTHSGGSPRFGERVRVHGDYFMVSAPLWERSPGTDSTGALYIYKKQQDNSWERLHSIYVADIAGTLLELRTFELADGLAAFTIVNSGEEGEVYLVGFNDTQVELLDFPAPASTSFYNGWALKLTDTRFIITDYTLNNRRGGFYHYRLQSGEWQDSGNYISANQFTYLGTDIEFDGDEVLAATFNSVHVIGVQPPTITSVTQGNSSSYARINWENNSGIGDIRFKIFRDDEEIATTSGSASSYYDYEGVPGKMHSYSVHTYDPATVWNSRPAIGHGYKQPAGIVEGKVQTPLGAGIKEVEVTIEPRNLIMHRALSVTSAENAMAVRRFNDAPDSAITVSFWLKTSANDNATLFDFVSENRDDAFTIRNPQSITISVNNNSIFTPVNLADGMWHHVAVTWRSTDGQLYVYDNGDQVFQAKFMAGEYFMTPDASVYFGADHANTSGDSLLDVFSGHLDELRIWNTDRSDSLIASDLYTRFIGNEDGLVSYYNFDDPQRFNNSFIPDLVWRRANHASVVDPVYLTDAGEVISQKRKAVTDAGGKFRFKNVYYDESREFEVVPFKQDHGFLPDVQFITLDSENAAERTVEFDDTTSFTVSGFVRYSTTNCPLPGAEILLNGQRTGVFTAGDGSYRLTIEEPGNSQIEVVFEDSMRSHEFRPSSLVLNVTDNLFDINFDDITTSRLYGRVGAACDNSFGIATLRITSTGNRGSCFERFVDTDTDGNFSIDLPSQEYRVEVSQMAPEFELIRQSYRIVTTNLTFQDTLLNFVYRNTPVIRIEGLPEICSTAQAPFRVPVVNQYEKYPITILVFDSYEGDSCLVDTGTVTIFDDIGGDPNVPVELKISNGQAHYTITAGEPNIVAGGDHPFQKLFGMTAEVDGYTASHNQWMLVTGHRPRGETFVTKTPELPLLILRDPPGDESYAYYEQGSATSTNYSMSHQIGGTLGAYASLKIGAGIPIPFTGYVLGSSVNIETSATAGASGTLGSAFSSTFNFSEKFSTSGNDEITGEKGDVFIGASFNMIYALTDVIAFDEATCSVVRDTQLVWGSEEINTNYIYTETHIRNTLLPQLRQLRTLSSPDSATLIGTYIDVWEQVLEKNQKLKRDAEKIRNLSFSAGTSREYSETVTQESTISFDFTTFIEREIKVGLAIGDGGLFSDIEVGVAASFRWEMQLNSSTTNQNTTTVGYVLGDNDPGDFFSVDVKSDAVYQTPVFDLVGGRSSCPWEAGSQPRDGVQLTMDSYVRNNVPLGQKAAFTLFLGNTSQSDESRDYSLSVIQSSNLDGAIISVGGVVIEDALNYTIPAGEQFNATLAVERGPLAWDYENLKLRLYAPCDPSISDTINFSVHFDSPCSNVNIFRPDNEWIVNITNNDTLLVILNDYNRQDPDLEYISLEYRKISEAWKTGFTIRKNELPENYIAYKWDVTDLTNGEYELRASARCGSQGISYSAIRRGRIDRSALAVFGRPEPADEILNIGDDIKITFTEDLDCDALSANAIQLSDEAGNLIAVNLACSGNEIIVSPQNGLLQYEGLRLTATVGNVKDVSGNVLREPFRWSFTVNQNPVYFSRSNTSATFYQDEISTLTATLTYGGGQNEQFNIVSLPTWLSGSNLSGSIPAGGSEDIIFEISSDLNPGRYSDTVLAETGGGNEPFIVDLTILAKPPNWSVNGAAYAYSMNFTVQLNIEGSASDDPFDLVSAYIGPESRGVAHIEFVSDLYGYLAFITVYSNTVSGEQISFRGWDASEGNEYAQVNESFVFRNGTALGSLSNPVILNPQGVAQTIDLNQGWTWISLNTEAADMSPDAVLNEVQPSQGDIIKSQTAFAQYITGSGWQGSLDRLQVGKAYFVKLSDASKLRFIGSRVNAAERPVTLNLGWNWIGYPANKIVDINTALAGYAPAGGDRIKSQDGFAEFDAANGSWIGSLQFMRPGQGYQINSNIAANISFDGLEKVTIKNTASGVPESWQVTPGNYEYNMSVIADISFDSNTGIDSTDALAAFIGDECRGIANPVFIPAINRYQVFLTIYGDSLTGEEITFRLLEGESGIIYRSANRLSFEPDDLAGSIINPVIIESAFATDDGALPDRFHLYRNYPNPFNPATTIRYELPQRADVRLAVYNILGQEVASLVNETQNAGRYEISFDAAGLNLSSGLYFYSFKAGAYQKIYKMMLIK